MWIASVLGFYSVVKKGGPGQWQVRGREKQDLLNLLAAMNLPVDRLIVSRDTDYAYRIIVDAAELGQVFVALAETVTYPNFKSEVARRPDQRNKLGPYHRIWSILAELQQPAESSVKTESPPARRGRAMNRSVETDNRGKPGKRSTL